VDVSTSVLGNDALLTGYFQKLLGDSLVLVGQGDQGAPHLDAAIAILRRVGMNQPLLGEALHHRAVLAYRNADLEHAERLAREGVAVRTAAYGDNSFDLSLTVGLLGIIHFDSGNPGTATPFFERSARIAEQTAGQDNLHLAEVQYYLGRCNTIAGKYADAAKLLSSSLSTRRSRLGEENAQTLNSLYYLGDALERGGATYEAVARYEQALSIARKLHDDDSLTTAVILFDLSQQYVKLDAYLKARPLLEEALSMQRLHAGNNVTRTGLVLLRMADLLYHQKQYQPSERCARESLEILERTAGAESGLVAEAAFRLASVYQLTNRKDQGVPLYERAIAIHRANGNLVAQMIAYESLATLLVELENVDEAVRQMEAAYKTVQDQAPESELSKAVQGVLRNLYQRAGREHEAEALLKKARNRSDLLRAESGLA
jgi:tetratricopeptide (TPR) repeat protein